MLDDFPLKLWYDAVGFISIIVYFIQQATNRARHHEQLMIMAMNCAGRETLYTPQKNKQQVEKAEENT